MTKESAAPDTLTLQQALERAQAHWNAGQVAQAEQLCQRVLAAWPGQADALHLLGLMAHDFGNLDLALEHLTAACKAPRAPAVYSANLAEMCRRKGLLAQAEEAARRAVGLDPNLVAGWNNLGIVLQEAGKYEESRVCLERVIALQPDDAGAHNNLGNTYRRLNRFDLAERHYRQALALHPGYAQAHSNLAFLLSTQGRFDEAAREARAAIELEPRLIDAYLNLAEVENARQNPAAAHQALDMLAGFAPRHPVAILARAKLLRQTERLDEALAAARDAVALAPLNADAHCTLAQTLQSLGHTADALDAYAQAMQLPGTVSEDALLGRATALLEAGRKQEALDAFQHVLDRYPGSIHAITGRAEARKYRAGDPDIEALEAFVAEGDSRSLTDHVAARFALGKAYMDTGDAARAFAHLDEGNRLKRRQIAYDARNTDAWMAHIARVFGGARIAPASPHEAPSSLPVFVIGMPRSGTTLVEQILASHSQVTGAGELSALRVAVEQAGTFPDRHAALNAEQLAHIGEHYLRQVAPLAKGRARLVDKMPANFLYAGLIPRVLPGARIIHVRRDPVDTCLSCYTKLFGGDQRFSYDQRELGAFYRSYEALMASLRGVLPAERFIEVEYEAIVDDLEREARRMIDFLGLEWEDACLAFHEQARVVRTASVSQVRQPLYSTSKGRWRAYEAHLQPLLDALGVTRA